ncbi:hypothetical protein LQ327_22380 [Actinomycetospora endophytica]|uniref:Uncharacterized protein n=1 Tax=Actinomycetospora endophytica TaxID=2291215 RepID=A0ABS8PDQ7_9PSEU|nr:hypothetical protein [Actinomycetospora endophytica]MCD2196123.1 hypothetical protein [Actinomycetospora endophytica]
MLDRVRASTVHAVRRALALVTADLVDLGGEALAAVGLTLVGALSGVLGASRSEDVRTRPPLVEDRYGNVRILGAAGARRRRPVPEVPAAAPSNRGRQW